MHLNFISSGMAAYIRKDTKLCVDVKLYTLLFLNSY